MSGRRAKRLRREARERGELRKPKRLFAPVTIPMPDGKGGTVEVAMPRAVRRKIMRQFATDLRKGRISLDGGKISRKSV